MTDPVRESVATTLVSTTVGSMITAGAATQFRHVIVPDDNVSSTAWSVGTSNVVLVVVVPESSDKLVNDETVAELVVSVVVLKSSMLVVVFCFPPLVLLGRTWRSARTPL